MPVPSNRQRNLKSQSNVASTASASVSSINNSEIKTITNTTLLGGYQSYYNKPNKNVFNIS